MSESSRKRRTAVSGVAGCLSELLEPRLMLSGTQYVVNSLADVVADDGVVTLREALQAANTNTAVTADVLAGSDGEVDRITFDVPALQAEVGPGNPLVIALDGTALTVSDGLELSGPGADVLTVDAAGKSGVFAISGERAVALSGLSIINGNSTYGGGLHIGAAQTALTDLTIRGCRASLGGGGLYNASRSLRLSNVIVSGNQSGYSGGGIHHASGLLAMAHGAVLNNAASVGGGMYAAQGELALSDVTVSGNAAQSNGGGIYGHIAAKVILENVDVSANTAAWSGGGVYSRGILSVTQAAFTWNTAGRGGGGLCCVAVAGGHNWPAIATVSRTQFQHNTAGWWGGGVSVEGSELVLTESLVSQNTAPNGGGVWCSITGDQAVIPGTLTMRHVTVSDNSGGGVDLMNNWGNPCTATLESVTVSGNAGGHGGIHNSGTMTLTDVEVSGTSSQYAVHNETGGQLRMIGGVIRENGGTGVLNSATMELRDVAILDNHQAYFNGGGIINSGSLTLVRAVVSGNSAWSGGGIVSGGSSSLSRLVVIDSEVSGNAALHSWGGGLYLHGTGEAMLANTTVSGNSAAQEGGGIHSSGTLTLINVTVSANHASLASGGLRSYGQSTLHNTLLAGNTAGEERGPSDLVGVVGQGSSHSLVGVAIEAVGLVDGVQGNRLGTSNIPFDALLGPLADNGGPTWTHSLLADSPAIDAGSDERAAEAGLTADQRGLAWFDGDGDSVVRVDIGAFEWRPPTTVTASHVFYNNSGLDGFDPAANVGDDAAIDATKQPMLAGQAVSAANLTSYARGLNGLMFDIADLGGRGVTAGDFTVRLCTDGATWATGPGPAVSVRPGAGDGGSDRVTLTWPDGAISDVWLEVTANTSLGLAEPQTFRVGNLRGDVNGDAVVDDRDLSILLGHWGDSGAAAADGDATGDGRVDDADLSVLLGHWGDSLVDLAALAAPPDVAAAPAEVLAAPAPLAQAPTTEAVAAPTAVLPDVARTPPAVGARQGDGQTLRPMRPTPAALASLAAGPEAAQAQGPERGQEPFLRLPPLPGLTAFGPERGGRKGVRNLFWGPERGQEPFLGLPPLPGLTAFDPAYALSSQSGDSVAALHTPRTPCAAEDCILYTIEISQSTGSGWNGTRAGD